VEFDDARVGNELGAGLPVPREPASLASAARMAKRSQRGASEGRSP